MRTVYLVTFFLVVLLIAGYGFRGTLFTKPPMDVFPEWMFPGMKRQAKYKAQAASPFFADGRADRPLPDGVVPAGYGPLARPWSGDLPLLQGKNPDGSFARGFPASIVVDDKFMERGRERYTIYCSPCHGGLGTGKGIVSQYGMAPANFQDDRIRQMAEGEIFNTITHGKSTMLSYADKLAPTDRWAVIAYVRALERARGGAAADVPPEHRQELGLK
ncbi:MAG: cytochrome c [Opitutaceae bacterium]|jgi:mono/diheme cytochrome c family protein